MDGLLPIPHQAITKPIIEIVIKIQKKIKKIYLKMSAKCWQVCSDPDVLTLQMLEMEYSNFGVNIMPADALAPKVASASAGMVSTVWDRQHVLLFQR